MDKMKLLKAVLSFLTITCLYTGIFAMGNVSYGTNLNPSNHFNRRYCNEITALWKMYRKAHTKSMNKDEAIKGNDKSAIERIHNVDIQINKKLKQLIHRYGWPSYSLVGKSGSDRAFSLIIYQRDDLTFQKKATRVIRALAKEKHASWSKYAHLYDLVIIHQGKEQIYGTQLEGVKVGNSCVLLPKPIHDASNVNKRRTEVGLRDTEAEYVKHAMAEDCPAAKLDNVNINYIRQLLDLFNKDQIIRENHDTEHYGSVAIKQGEKLKALIRKYGWPSYVNVGSAADKAVVLFIHQDNDLQFQKRALAAVSSLAEKKEIGLPEYAYLYDSVMVNEGSEQLYGTQGHCIDDGSWQPAPIKDPHHLYERREHFNLNKSNGTESEYKDRLDRICRKEMTSKKSK